MAVKAFPLRDGIAPSFGRISVSMSPARPPGIAGRAAGAASSVASAAGVSILTLDMLQAINTGTVVETENIHQGGIVVARTTGQETPSASLVFYLQGFQEFLRRISLVAPIRGLQRQVSLVEFDLDYMYQLEGNPDLYGTRIKGCRYMGREKNDAQGNAATLVTVNISVRKVVDVVNNIEMACL